MKEHLIEIIKSIKNIDNPNLSYSLCDTTEILSSRSYFCLFLYEYNPANGKRCVLWFRDTDKDFCETRFINKLIRYLNNQPHLKYDQNISSK